MANSFGINRNGQPLVVCFDKGDSVNVAVSANLEKGCSDFSLDEPVMTLIDHIGLQIIPSNGTPRMCISVGQVSCTFVREGDSWRSLDQSGQWQIVAS